MFEMIHFNKSMIAYDIDYAMGRVLNSQQCVIDPGTVLFRVGTFDKGILVNIEPVYNEKTLAVRCKTQDFSKVI